MTDKENSTLIRAKAEHTIAVEDDERKFNHQYTWNSCCLRVDKRAQLLHTSFVLSLDSWLLHHVAESQPRLCYVFKIQPSANLGDRSLVA